MEILEKIYANAVLLGDDGPEGWGIKYNIEFMMNTDAHLFPARPQWEEKGYRPDEYSRWLRGDWRPIEELWEEMGVDPSRPESSATKLEDWLFDTTAGPEPRQAAARFAHGHWLRPGDVAGPSGARVARSRRTTRYQSRGPVSRRASSSRGRAMHGSRRRRSATSRCLIPGHHDPVVPAECLAAGSAAPACGLSGTTATSGTCTGIRNT